MPEGLDGPPTVAGAYADRAEAGRVLAEHVAACQGLADPVVVALPRGGVPVGAEVARRLGAPLVAIPASKVGAPGQEELALGAVAPGGVSVLNNEVVAALGLRPDEVDALVAKAAAKVAQQLQSYGRYQSYDLSLAGRAAVVVDDGLATGATMWAALIAVRDRRPALLVLAVPVAPPSVLMALAPLVDKEVCPLQPSRMFAVGSWYKDFTQTTDAEVADLLGSLNPQRSSSQTGRSHLRQAGR